MSARQRSRYGLSRPVCVYGGIGAIIVGSYLLQLGFEGSGKTRPWAIKLLPGA